MLYYSVLFCILFISLGYAAPSKSMLSTPQPEQQQHQHIAIFNSSLDTEFLASLNNTAGQNFKVLSFDDHTHILLGNFHHPDHSTLVKRQNGWMNLELNQKISIANHNTIQLHNNNHKNNIARDNKNNTVQGPYSVQLDVPSWGLSRISQRQLPLVNAFGYPHDAGEGVDIYIVDSGVDANNSDFGGRGTIGGNFIRGSPDDDENGHGTILAGIAAGTEYGVAKKANIISVKCLSANGTGDIGTIIEGLHYILHHIQSGRQPPRAIVNLSLVAKKSVALNQATDALTKAGAIVVAAAGNYHEEDDPSSRNACNFSPASASTAITIGSTDENDQFASFSNDGHCIDILAPGTSILSDSKHGDNATAKGIKTWYSGTSYSVPHVAGVLALLSNQQRQQNNDNSSNSLMKQNQQVIQHLFTLATPDIISNVTKGTPNLLVYNGVETSQMSATLSANKHRSNANTIIRSDWILFFIFLCWSLFL